MSIIDVLATDDKFKSNIKFATAIFAAVSLYGTYYSLNKRVTDIENRFAKPGEVEVILEKPEVIKKPIAKVKDTTSRLYNNKTMIRMDSYDLTCLARNIYHEARFEPYIGKIAVAQVTFNRVLDGKWGNSICGVVYARKQFSWTLDKKLKYAQPKGHRWNQAMHVAKMFQYGVRVRDLTPKVKWYHAAYIQPYWRNDYRRITKLGQHIFYASAS